MIPVFVKVIGDNGDGTKLGDFAPSDISELVKVFQEYLCDLPLPPEDEDWDACEFVSAEFTLDGNRNLVFQISVEPE